MAINNRAQILISAIDDTKKAFKSVEANILSLKNIASGVGDTLRKSIGFIGLGITAKELASVSDKYKELRARLQLSVFSLEEFNIANKELFDIAQRNRSSLENTVILFTKVAQAVRELGYEQRDALIFTELINQTIILSGTSANSAAGSLIQLGHIFAFGSARAKEFYSLLVNIPRLAQAIADGLNISIRGLQELVHQGKLSDKLIIDSLLSQQERLKIESDALADTISGSLVRLKNSFLVVFGSQSFGATNILAKAIEKLAQNLKFLTNLVGVILVATFGRMVSAIVLNVISINAESAARLVQLRLIKSEAVSRLLTAKATLAESVARGINTDKIRKSIAAYTGEAIAANTAVRAASSSTGFLARTSGLLSVVFRLLGGWIGIIITALSLVTLAIYSFRNKLVDLGGVSANIGQIISATWSIIADKIKSAFNYLLSFVSLSKKTLEKIADIFSSIPSAIGTSLIVFSNSIIAVFNIIGSVAGTTAGFIVDRFKAAFENISNLFLTFLNFTSGRFSLTNLKNLLSQQKKEFVNFSDEIDDILKKSLSKNYIGYISDVIKKKADNAIAKIASRIKKQSESSDVFGKRGADDSGDNQEKNRERLRLVAASYDAEYEIIKDGLNRVSSKIDRDFKERLISIRKYYNDKKEIEQALVDEDIKRIKNLLAIKKELLESGDVDNSGVDIRADIIKLESDLIILNNKRADVEIKNAEKSIDAERELAEQLRKVKFELASITKSSNLDSLNRDDIVSQFSNLRERLSVEGNREGVDLIDKLIDVKTAQANLAEIELQWRLSIKRLNDNIDAVKIKQNSGLIAEYQAQKEISDLKKQTAKELDVLYSNIETSSFYINDEATSGLIALRNEINNLKIETSALDDLFDSIFDSFSSSFLEMITFSKNWRDSLTDVFRQVYISFIKYIVIDNFKQWLAMKVKMVNAERGFAQQTTSIQLSSAEQSLSIKSAETVTSVSMDAAKAGAGAAASQASIPYIGPALAIAAMVAMVAAVLALLSNVKKYAQGGLVSGPGTSKSDSISAKLSVGEYVLNADAVKRVGIDFLNSINGFNEGPSVLNNVVYFSKGGIVDPVSSENTQQSSQSVKIINVIDPSLASDYLNSSSGEKSVLNIIHRNSGLIKQVLV